MLFRRHPLTGSAQKLGVEKNIFYNCPQFGPSCFPDDFFKGNLGCNHSPPLLGLSLSVINLLFPSNLKETNVLRKEWMSQFYHALFQLSIRNKQYCNMKVIFSSTPWCLMRNRKRGGEREKK